MRTNRLHYILLAGSLAVLGACSQEPAEAPAPAPDMSTTETAAPEVATPEAAPEAAETESLTAQLEARVARFKEMAPPERIAAAEGAINRARTARIRP